LDTTFNLRKIPKTSLHTDTDSELKRGRYISSVFPVEGYGTKKWVIGCYIDLDKDVAEDQEQETVEKILAILNRPPKRKRFERKRLSPLYGNLEVFSAKFKKDADGNPYVEMMLVTDDQSNENFWGKGVQMLQTKPRRRKKVQTVI